MMQPANEISVKPEIEYLENLLAAIAAGKLRVPFFRRPFAWCPEQMLDLYDSLERGYPIGSILAWETTSVIPSLNEIGNLKIPPSGK